jgi:hypothetical protein
METSLDFDSQLMLDGNAVAGLLFEIFSTEMTIAPTRCAGCGREGEMGSLQAYLHGPGVVLRCPTCKQVIMRVVRTPHGTYIDARGAAYLLLPGSQVF